MRHVAPIAPRLADSDADRVRRAHHDAIVTLQQMPSASLQVIANVTLTDGTATPVSHGLGRAPAWVAPSCPRNATSAGYIVEVRDGSTDRTKQVLLKASGFGATITVDVVVL